MARVHMYFVQPEPGGVWASVVGAETFRRQVAEAAYLRAEARGFAPGHELEDWVAAEREIESRIADEAHRH